MSLQTTPSQLQKNWVFDAHPNPPVYTRPLLGSELEKWRQEVAKDGTTQLCIGISFTSSLKAEELKVRTRDALDKLRFLCPIVACSIEDSLHARWVYTPSADRGAWLNLAFAVEERGESLDPYQFIQSMNSKPIDYTDGNGNSTRFRAYLLTTSKEGDDEDKEYGLFFHASHAMFDAKPVHHALSLMCEWMSGKGMDVTIEPAEEWKNLPVDAITATGGPSEEWETEGPKLLQEFYDQKARTLAPHMFTPPPQPLSLSHPPFYPSITVPESETAAIITKAKQIGISVSTLFYAAHCLAHVKLNPIPEGTEVDFTSDMIVVALERFLKPPINPRTYLTSGTTVFPSRFSMTGPLAEPTEKARLIKTATLLQERMNRFLANPCLPHLLPVLTSMTPPEVTLDHSSGQEGAKHVRPLTWRVGCHSLGILDIKLPMTQEITVKNMYIGARIDTSYWVYVWTMNSKFTLQAMAAAAWGEERPKALLEEMLRICKLILDES